MNLSPVRTALRHKTDYVCLSCLLGIHSTPRWQQPVRNRGSRVIIPTLSSSVAASLHETIDQADRERARGVKKKPSKAKTDGSPSNTAPPSSSPMPSKKSVILDERPSDPSIASFKAKSARIERRAKRTRRDHAESGEMVSPKKRLNRKDASPEEEFSGNKDTLVSKATMKSGDEVETPIEDQAGIARLLNSLRDRASRSRLETTIDLKVREQQEYQAKKEGSETYPSKTEGNNITLVESQGSANSPSDTLLLSKILSPLRLQLCGVTTSEDVAIKKLGSDNPPQSSLKAQTVRPKQSKPRARLVQVRPKARLVASSSKVLESIQKKNKGESRRTMALEGHSKEHTKSVQAALGGKALRKAKTLLVSRTVSEREQQKVKPPIQQVNAADLSITGLCSLKPDYATLVTD